MGPITVGIVLILLGGALRVWGLYHLSQALPFADIFVVVKPPRVVSSGPYRFTPHPLYLGSLMIITGIGLIALGWGGIVLAVPAVPFFERSALVEDRLVLEARMRDLVEEGSQELETRSSE